MVAAVVLYDPDIAHDSRDRHCADGPDTLSRALRERFDQHRAIARWTFPLWLYVSVTGVVVYMMLYRIFV